jgi:oligosaccharide reducing-end xylanase
MRFPFVSSFAGSLVLAVVAATAGCADDSPSDQHGNVGQAESGGTGGTPTVGQGGKAGGSVTAGSGGSSPSTPRAACTAPATYRNLFTELLGKTDAEVASKLDAAFQKLFHGGDNETVYYESGTDEAYILDVNSNDVRSEGMSYGMMIAVQLDKREEFDRLWKWSMSHMYQSQTGYFAWQLTPQGQVMSPYSAPDGEEYFATALIFAANRWGDGSGIFAYSTQARALLDALVNRGNFNRTHKLVTFGASGQSAMHTDPSYILPAFYEVWACYDSKNRQFWQDAVKAARAFFPKTCHGTTGLAPYQANFDGTPYAGTHFQSDSWRVVGNIMMDHNLFAADP